MSEHPLYDAVVAELGEPPVTPTSETLRLLAEWTLDCRDLPALVEEAAV